MEVDKGGLFVVTIVTIVIEGGDKVPISKFGLDTSCVVFIGPIKTYLVF